MEEVGVEENGMIENDDVPEITGKEIEIECKKEKEISSNNIQNNKIDEEVKEQENDKEEMQKDIVEVEIEKEFCQDVKTEGSRENKLKEKVELDQECKTSKAEVPNIAEEIAKDAKISPKSNESPSQTIEKPPSIPKELSKKLRPAVETTSSPLLSKPVHTSLINYGHSLDSKQVDETIEYIEFDNICKCLAFALLKHIEFSKGEVLIDDLVSEEEDIPQFSYEFGQDLRIDLEEIQQRKEMEKWEAQERNYQNFQYMQQVLKEGQPFDYQAYQHHFESKSKYNP